MKTIITLLLLTILMPVNADKLGECNIFSEFAGTMMKYRQDNVEMSELIIFVRKQNPDTATKTFAEAIIKDAYRQPLYSSSKYKLRAIKKFKNDIFLECYK